MSRSESVAATLVLTSWACVLPAFFHHFLPLVAWLSAWAVLMATKETRHD